MRAVTCPFPLNGHPFSSLASVVAQMIKNSPLMQETWAWSLGWEDPWRRECLPTPVFSPGESHGERSLWGCRVRHDWATNILSHLPPPFNWDWKSQILSLYHHPLSTLAMWYRAMADEYVFAKGEIMVEKKAFFLDKWERVRRQPYYCLHSAFALDT